MSAVPTAGYEWTFDPDRSDGGITVDSVDSDMPEYRPGKSYSLDLVFWENLDDRTKTEAETGGTLGGPAGFTLGGSTGATLGSPSDPTGHLDRYEAVREYTRWAGRYKVQKAIDGTPNFHETTPASATVDSIVVKLVPGPELPTTDSLWVALDDVDDKTTFPEDLARMTLRFTVLARGDQYDTRTDIKNALGNDLA